MQSPSDILTAIRCLQQLSSKRIPGVELARAEGLGLEETDALLSRLQGAGLVTQIGDDYRLAVPESEIRISDVQRALAANGPLGRWSRMTLAEVGAWEDELFESEHTALAV